ncbi:MAG: hypothetical protein R3316_04445 [Rhodovibrionaceae bacterium]|nr:hypothetical protein [Rhodovibrionaceae bacterium]
MKTKKWLTVLTLAAFAGLLGGCSSLGVPEGSPDYGAAPWYWKGYEVTKAY